MWSTPRTRSSTGRAPHARARSGPITSTSTAAARASAGATAPQPTRPSCRGNRPTPRGSSAAVAAARAARRSMR
eukprot:6001075-Prymnesium_polylepis.1